MAKTLLLASSTNSRGCQEMDYGADKERRPSSEDEFEMTGID